MHIVMKKTRYTEEQVAFALKQAETGTRVWRSLQKDGHFICLILQLEEPV